MIIKSMPRKNGSYLSFQQLYDYITRDNGCDQRFNFSHNFFADDREAILNEFVRNAGYIPKRKNGNYLYHEILSFTRSSQLSEFEQLEIIRKVAIRYVQDRARGCLAFGGVHTDKDNQLHVHLIISANQLDQSKKHSLSTQAYDQIKRSSEAYVLNEYPEMEQEKLISQSQDEKLQRRSQREQEFQKRTGKKSDKQLFTEQVETIMNQANSDQQFRELLELHGIAYKYKPANITLTNPHTKSKRNTHRIKSIGLQEAYDAMIEREQNSKSQQSEEIQEEQAKNQQSRTGKKR